MVLPKYGTAIVWTHDSRHVNVFQCAVGSEVSLLLQRTKRRRTCPAVPWTRKPDSDSQEERALGDDPHPDGQEHHLTRDPASDKESFGNLEKCTAIYVELRTGSHY